MPCASWLDCRPLGAPAHPVANVPASRWDELIVFGGMGDHEAPVKGSDLESQLEELRGEERLLWAVAALARRSSGRLGLDELDVVLAGCTSKPSAVPPQRHPSR